MFCNRKSIEKFFNCAYLQIHQKMFDFFSELIILYINLRKGEIHVS